MIYFILYHALMTKSRKIPTNVSWKCRLKSKIKCQPRSSIKFSMQLNPCFYFDQRKFTIIPRHNLVAHRITGTAALFPKEVCEKYRDR